MRLVRYGERGREKPGLLDLDGRLRDLSAEIDDVAGAALEPETLDRLRALEPESLPLVENSPLIGAGPGVASPRHPLDARPGRGPLEPQPGRRVRLGACVGRVGKLICIGLNYADHAAETGAKVPSEPVVFMKATSAITGPFDDVEIPRGSQKTDWEVELGVVIGRAAKYVDEAEAMEHVAGYCVVNDLSERAFQTEGTGQWTKGKSADTFAPLGPWLVTADEIADPQKLELWLEVDGERMQHGSTQTMVYPVRFLVSYLSRFMSLQPGDVISTGTPPGVGMGRKPPRYLRAGQRMTLSVDGLGTQSQTTVAGRRVLSDFPE